MNAELERRVTRVAESILENEALTANLDDEAADLFLKWALRRAEVIVRSTAELDDEAAEEAIYQPLRSLKRMGRSLPRWARNPEGTLERLLTYAEKVYGAGFVSPDSQACAAL